MFVGNSEDTMVSKASFVQLTFAAFVFVFRVLFCVPGVPIHTLPITVPDLFDCLGGNSDHPKV